MEEIKLLTFNIWGLKYVSKHRRPRIQGIVEKLKDPSEDYHVIALQEVWCQEDWDLFDTQLSSQYPFRRWFHSGVVSGPGLAILSKIPINDTFLYRFPVNGRSAAVNRGDFFVGKSLSITMLSNGIAICNSHMHAPYSLDGQESYLAHRACQAWDIVRIIGLLKSAGYHIVLVGDLNSRPSSLPHKLFTMDAQLHDSWELLKQANDQPIELNMAELSPKDQIIMGGITCDSQLNTWRKHRAINEACRLDYALISNGLTVLDAAVRFVDTLPVYNCSYSDHFAYYVKLRIKDKTSVPNARANDISFGHFELYRELIGTIDHDITFTIPGYYSWRILYTVLSVLAIIVMIGFTPIAGPYAIIFMVISPVLAITATLNFLIWYIGGRQEFRALTEVKQEILDRLNSRT